MAIIATNAIIIRSSSNGAAVATAMTGTIGTTAITIAAAANSKRKDSDNPSSNFNGYINRANLVDIAFFIP
jgi:hypothetical protein